MCDPVTIGLLASAAVGAVSAGVSHVQANQQAADQRGATANAAQKAGTAQPGTPADTSQLNPGGTPAAAGVNSGPASTMLTGPGGVSNGSLNLGGGGGQGVQGGLLGSNTLLGS
jgi:hypothetical protein